MSIFRCLKWPEMRAVALELIRHMHEGHARGQFAIPVVEFLGVFSPGASPSELAKVGERAALQFTATSADGGLFTLPPGARALFDLHREGLVMRLPERMSGTYALRTESFIINFTEGEELEGCKRLLLLVCNRVRSVEVTPARVDVHMPHRMLDLCVEF